MAEWQKVSLGSLAANEPGAIAIGPFGSRMKAELYVPSGVPIIRGVNISDGRSWKGNWVFVPEAFAAEMPNCLARAGDLVFPHRGSIGEVALVPDDGVTYMISTSLMKFRADTTRVLPEFLLYFFRSQKGREEILRFSSQVGTPGIGQPLTSLRQFRVDLPPLPAQGAIAAVLNSLDDKIELNRRMNETLEAMARAIFQDWFVTFGPTRAKMEGCPPYLAHDLWALFPDRLDAEGKPAGWETEPLLDHARIISGGTPKTDETAYWNGGILWASAKDVSQCKDPFLIATERTITERGLDESATRMVPRAATVVVARGATTGRSCMFGRAMAMNQTCYALASTWERPFWLNCTFNALVTGLVHAAHGSVFDTITTKTIEGARTINPGSTLLDRFEQIVAPMFAKMLANVEEAASLATTRDLLLPRLMSGELRVNDAERMLEPAA